ncbi:MAG: N-acetylneuraminate synthase family protein [Gemmatimonadaceae bacterium]|nr:N-acetylneuraminate synthase family protein [Gemmatimonadaceae bacterium]
MTGFMGRDHVLVVAEGGSNHGGSLEATLALTDAAADAGADAMKWQLWHHEEMYEAGTEEYATAEKWQLPATYEWLGALRKRAHDRGMLFGLSSFGLRALNAADIYADFHKVASIEATWGLFVQAVLGKGKPTIISTGMMDRAGEFGFGSVFRNGYGWWTGSGNARDVVLLGCTVAYPCPIEDANVASLADLAYEVQQYRLAGFGLSDHTTHPTIAPCAAVALGASVIEKHIRPQRPGWITPDWDHSIDPLQFREMVAAIRLTEQALGSSEKRIRPSEEKYIKYRRGPRGLRGA